MCETGDIRWDGFNDSKKGTKERVKENVSGGYNFS
jgi:hypothetical protein